MKFASIALTNAPTPTPTPTPAHAASVAAPTVHARTTNDSAASNNTPQPSITRAAPTHADTTPYLCQPGAYACIAGGPLLASSQAEAHWLIAHGYPSPA
ncbi:hypothetical protein J155_00200 [Xanthomonas citri pv. citri]|nr:Hypothetical Protein XCAW_00474 [Xanthomonas citri subsp. citri Aw12879]AJD66673.1 hypothetical protein J151_00201 [Xanthomonas citri subsp. citri A306]AJY80208.1 hypothetical protein J159_00199 [Xanthomonas citri pv. citri]AJY84630.1 hypothetical protein J158_00199 [Xanthomonas citri subsp. citri UI6]QYF42854.1 hypothetical protein HZS93_00097 [Xanthomonas citri]